MTRKDTTRQNTRQHKNTTRQGKARQDKTSQEKQASKRRNAKAYLLLLAYLLINRRSKKRLFWDLFLSYVISAL
jgi:hypothetical protein